MNAYIKRGIVHLDLGDNRGGLEDLESAVQLQPKNPEAYYHRGNTRRSLGDVSGAIIDFETAIKFNPLYYQAYNDMAIVRLKTGDISGAMKNFLLFHCPTPLLYFEFFIEILFICKRNRLLEARK
ncbi:MAG: hypothetical protein MGF17_04350 [Trichodesmium sp. MAG_R04]|nr:hypothetical protein [Trichodesmium sp. MAG_R04]